MLMTHNPITDEPIIKIRNENIKRVHSASFLGIKLGDRLSFGEHIETVCKKMSRAVGVMFRLSTIIPCCLLSTLYFSLLYSHMIYGITIWGRANLTGLNEIKKINRRAELLLGKDFSDRYR